MPNPLSKNAFGFKKGISCASEISLFNKDKRRTATVKANSKCSIGKLKFTDLSEICNKNTKVGYQIMKNVGEIITKQLVRSNNNVLKLTTAFGLMIDK